MIITAIRMISYYKEELSEELAKMLPLTLLAIFVLNPNSFSDIFYLEKIITHLLNITSFFGDILKYLIFIMIIETILRFFDYLFSILGVNLKEQVKEEQEKTAYIKNSN